MKWWAILILCILISSSYVSADKITLKIGDSYKDSGVNITFAKINKEYDKVVICVNDEKQILEEDQIAYFTNASLEVDHIDRKDRTIDIDLDWVDGCGKYCKCEGSCLNQGCKIELYDQFGNPLSGEEILVKENKSSEEIIETIDIIEQEKPNYGLIIFLSIIGGLIGIGLVWLFWFRKMPF